jgi:hypothetical protein
MSNNLPTAEGNFRLDCPLRTKEERFSLGVPLLQSTFHEHAIDVRASFVIQSEAPFWFRWRALPFPVHAMRNGPPLTLAPPPALIQVNKGPTAIEIRDRDLAQQWWDKEDVLSSHGVDPGHTMSITASGIVLLLITVIYTAVVE